MQSDINSQQINKNGASNSPTLPKRPWFADSPGLHGIANHPVPSSWQGWIITYLGTFGFGISLIFKLDGTVRSLGLVIALICLGLYILLPWSKRTSIWEDSDIGVAYLHSRKHKQLILAWVICVVVMLIAYSLIRK